MTSSFQLGGAHSSIVSAPPAISRSPRSAGASGGVPSAAVIAGAAPRVYPFFLFLPLPFFFPLAFFAFLTVTGAESSEVSPESSSVAVAVSA
jgi:hypothetical protein